MGPEVSLQDELLPSQIRLETGGATEELLSSLTHAVGAGLAIAGLVLLLILVRDHPDPWRYAGLTVYGVAQIGMFLVSAVTHSFSARPRIRRKLSVFDFSFIYIYIAGTYTPLGLIALRGRGGAAAVAAVWAIAVFGIALRIVAFERSRRVATWLYVAMVLPVALLIRPALDAVSSRFVIRLLVGMGLFAIGFAFYQLRRIPYTHVIWHLLVIGGAVGVFIAYATHLA